MSQQEQQQQKTPTPAPQKTPAPQPPSPVPQENSVQKAKVKTTRELNEDDRSRTDVAPRTEFKSSEPANLGNPHPKATGQTGPVVEHTQEHDGREGTRTKTIKTENGGTVTGQTKYEVNDGKLTAQQKRSTVTPGQNGKPSTTVTNQGRVSMSGNGPTASAGQTRRTGNLSQGKFLSFNKDGGSLTNRQDTHNDDNSTSTKTKTVHATKESVGFSQSKGKQFANGSEVSGRGGGSIILGQETRGTDGHTSDIAKGNGRMHVQKAGVALHAGFGANSGAFGVNAEGYFNHEVSNAVFSVDPKYAKMSDSAFKAAMAPAKGGMIGPTSLSTMDPALLEANQGYGLQTTTAFGGSVGATVYGVSGNVGGGKEYEQRSTLMNKDNGKLVMDMRTAESGYFNGGADVLGFGGEVESSSGKAGQVRMEFTPNAKGEYPAFEEFQKTGVLPGAMDKKDQDYKEYAELKDKADLSVHDNWRLNQISKRVNADFIKIGETSQQDMPKVDGVDYTHLRDFNRETFDVKGKALGAEVGKHRTEKTTERTKRVMTESEKKSEAETDELAGVKNPKKPLGPVQELKQTTTSGKEATLVHVDKEGDSRLLVQVDVQAKEWMLKSAEKLSGKKVERTDMIDRMFGDTHTVGGNVTAEHVKDMVKGDTNQETFKKASEYYREKQRKIDNADAWAGAKDSQFNDSKRSELIKDQGAAMLARNEWMKNRKISPQEFGSRMQAVKLSIKEQREKNPYARPRIDDRMILDYERDFQNVNAKIPGVSQTDFTPKERHELNAINNARNRQQMQDAMMSRHNRSGIPEMPQHVPAGDTLYSKHHSQLTDQHREMGDEAFAKKTVSPEVMGHMIDQYRRGKKMSAAAQRKLSPPNLREMSKVVDAKSMYQLGRTNPKAAQHLIDKNSSGSNRVYMALALPAAQSNKIINDEVRKLGNGRPEQRAEKIADMYLDVVKTATDSPDMSRAAKQRWSDLILRFNEGAW